MGILFFYAFIIMMACKLAVAFLSPQAQTLPALHRAMRDNPSRATKIAYALIWLQLITFIVIALFFGLKYFQAA